MQDIISIGHQQAITIYDKLYLNDGDAVASLLKG
jgi:hypothetical protein